MNQPVGIAQSVAPSLVGDKACNLGAAALLFLVLLPLQPTLPMSGLDPAWQQALDLAVARHLRFGVDVVFTFGPYVDVYTQLYDPTLFAVTFLCDALIATFILSAVNVIGLDAGHADAKRGRQLRTGVLLVFSLIAAYSPRDWLMVMPLLFFCLLLQGRQHSPLRRFGELTGAVTLALISLIKGGFLIASLSSLIMLPIAGVKMSRWLTAWATYAIAVVLFWMLAGQNIRDLPAFLSSSFAIVAGYSGAMSLSPKGAAIVEAAYLAAAFLVAWRSCTVLRFDRRGVGESATVLLALFLGFKAGLIRSDSDHIVMAVSMICLIACVVVLRIWELTRRRDAVLAWVAVASAATVFVLGLRAEAHGFSNGLQRVATIFLHSPLGLVHRIDNGVSLLSGADRFDRQRALALDDMRKAFPLGNAVGSADIYTYRQDILLANQLDWNPRPVFQSFVAYSPALQALNAAHLEGPKPPQQIYFRPETIDGRFPAMDDGASWPIIRSRYEVVDVIADFAHLVRRTSPISLPMEAAAPSKIAFGEDLMLGDASSSVYAQMDIHMTLAGRLLSLFYKLPALYIHVAAKPAGQAHAEEREFRLIAGEAESGFLLSPLITSTTDFVAWMQESKGSPVQRMSIRANWLARIAYSTPISVRLWRFAPSAVGQGPT